MLGVVHKVVCNKEGKGVRQTRTFIHFLIFSIGFSRTDRRGGLQILFWHTHFMNGGLRNSELKLLINAQKI